MSKCFEMYLKVALTRIDVDLIIIYDGRAGDPTNITDEIPYVRESSGEGQAIHTLM